MAQRIFLTLMSLACASAFGQEGLKVTPAMQEAVAAEVVADTAVVQAKFQGVRSMLRFESAQAYTNYLVRNSYQFYGGDLAIFIPTQVSVGLGVQDEGRVIEGEVYGATDLISAYGGGRPFNMAVGTRARLFLGKTRNFVELAGEKYLLNQDKEAAFRSGWSVGGGRAYDDGLRVAGGYRRWKTNPSGEYPNQHSVSAIYLRVQKKF
ncbi:MAG: hypothetical protein AB7N80_02005 [Bdellovibrionales bacterium]